MASLRAPKPAERVIILAFFDEIKQAKAHNDDPDRKVSYGRNMIYSFTATRCGVSYDRVVDLCHDRIYVQKTPGVWFHGWKMGEI